MVRIILFTSLLFTGLFSFESGFPKGFYGIKDAKEKKKVFISTLLPKIKKAEAEILSDRAFVKSFFDKYLFTYSFKSRGDIKRLITLSKKYRITQMYNEAEYLEKIDRIPVSLVLAQSAVESAWGDSRFAKEGNNLFGEWTWGKVGLIPAGRDENATHRLRIFKSLDASVARYMLNLNRHPSYEEFRALRAHKRALHQPFTGIEAANTMTNYSQMREAYNQLLIQMIKGNNFMKYGN